MKLSQNLCFFTTNNERLFHIVRIIMTVSITSGTGDMGDDLSSEMGGTLTLGLGSGNIAAGGGGGSGGIGVGASAAGDLSYVPQGVGNNTVTAVQPGDAARLACPIPAEMFGTKVSWMRKGDLQLLAVGENMYTHDHRFFVSHSRHSHNAHHSQVWFLHLMNVTKRDEGEYECQTSTHPHVSLVTFLKVQNAYSRIEGPEERVVASGSGLRLVCTIEGASSPPSHVFWYQYERMVNYDSSRGISVTQSSPMRSTLVIAEATADHAGNYTCQPSNAAPASVNVHVVAETTEPSATGRVGKKVAEKTPVRQLGVMSASSGGAESVSPMAPLALFCLLLLHALLIPSPDIVNPVSFKRQEEPGIPRMTKYNRNSNFLTSLLVRIKNYISVISQQENIVDVTVSSGLPK